MKRYEYMQVQVRSTEVADIANHTWNWELFSVTPVIEGSCPTDRQLMLFRREVANPL